MSEGALVSPLFDHHKNVILIIRAINHRVVKYLKLVSLGHDTAIF